MKKLVMFASVITVVILMFSCNLPGEEEDAVDFISHNINYSILVRNNTSERLIAFMGDLTPEMLIGGIPARATGHGLPNDPALFDRSKEFPLILLTEAQYNANKNNLDVLKNTPFTRVYVFYNRNGDNSAVYEISNNLGGNNSLRIINASTSVNVELRLGGVAGEIIGYAPAGMLQTTLRMQDGDYDIFPVFKRYNTARDVVETVYPKMANFDYSWFQNYSFEGGNEVVMDLKPLLGSLTFSSGSAWVVIRNQTTSGGIRFFEGSSPRRTPSGIETINSGNEITFQVDMPAIGTTYADSVTVANWSFGPQGFTIPLPSTVIERDKMYVINVTGNFQTGSLSVEIDEGVEIPATELGGAW